MVAGLVACAGVIPPASPAVADDGCGAGMLEVTTLPATAERCFGWSDLVAETDVATTYEPGDIRVSGVSMNQLLVNVLHLGRTQVRTTAVRGSSDNPSRLSTATNDFAEHYEDTFEDGPPAFYTNDLGKTISYIKPRRKTGSRQQTVGVGDEDTRALRLTVQIEKLPLEPTLDGPSSAPPGKLVKYSVLVPDPGTGESLTATTTFGDNSQVVTTSIGRSARTDLPPHGFPAPEYTTIYQVSTTVTGDAGSEGSDSLKVTVPGKKPPPPRSPPATSGPSRGAGGRSAPALAPPTGPGPVPTGTTAAPTDARGRAESGGADRSGPTGVRSGSAGAAGRAAGTSGAPVPAGVRIAGYALPAPGAVEPERAGRRPAAPAARSSVTPHAFPGWGLLAAVVVIGLAVLGGVTERRRPSRRPRRAA